MRPNKFRIKAAVDAAAQRDKTMRCFMAMAPLFPFALVDGSSPQHVLDKQYGFLHKDVQKSLIC